MKEENWKSKWFYPVCVEKRILLAQMWSMEACDYLLLNNLNESSSLLLRVHNSNGWNVYTVIPLQSWSVAESVLKLVDVWLGNIDQSVCIGT